MNIDTAVMEADLDLFSLQPTQNISTSEEHFFKVVADKQILLKAISHIQSIVEKRNVISILSHIKLDAKQGTLVLTATDIDIMAIEEINAQVEHQGSLTVPAHTLYDIVRKLPDNNPIELIANGVSTGRLHIHCGTCRFVIGFLPVENFPSMDQGTPNHILKVPAAELINIIDRCKFAISMDDSRFNITGIFLHKPDNSNSLRAVATDGHRLSCVDLSLDQNIPGIIIPRKTIYELRKILDDTNETVEIRLSDVKVSFVYKNIVLISKLIDGIFPNYENLIPKHNDKVLQVDAQTFTQAVDRVSTVTMFDKLRMVKLSATAKTLNISATGEINGTANEQIEAEFNGDELEVNFNSRYLLDILASIQGDTIELQFSGKYSPVIIKDISDQSSIYVVMPMLGD
jgi:DNA polymerase-3 subunit beta